MTWKPTGLVLMSFWKQEHCSSSLGNVLMVPQTGPTQLFTTRLEESHQNHACMKKKHLFCKFPPDQSSFSVSITKHIVILSNRVDSMLCIAINRELCGLQTRGAHTLRQVCLPVAYSPVCVLSFVDASGWDSRSPGSMAICPL